MGSNPDYLLKSFLLYYFLQETEEKEDQTEKIEEVNEDSKKNADEDDENVICSCPMCCCVCSCIKSISRIGTKLRKSTRDDSEMLWDQNNRNESIDLTNSQKRDLFALQNYGAFRNMNTNTYRYY